MKKFIALALSLVMALSLSVVAWGATMTESDLQNLLNADGTVTLTGNVTVGNGLSVPAGVTVTLDLAGYTISQTKAQTAGYQMLENKGNLTIMDSVGGGKLSYTDSGNGGEYISDTIYNRGTLVINGGTIENLSSATVASNGYPHAVDTYSGDRDTSVIINGGTIYCANYSAIRMFCVSATNKADLVINGGTIKGAVDMQNGTAAAALGSLTVNGGTFETTANANNIRFANWNGGATTYGITASITGGSFNGGITSAYVPAAANWDSGIITGGTFTEDVRDYVADGSNTATDVNGNLVVLAGTNAPASGAKGAYYTTDLTGLSVYHECDLNNFKYTLETYTPVVDVAKTFAKVAVWQTNKNTGAKTIVLTGVAASAGSANVAFVNGTSITYLNTTATQWSDKASTIATVDVKVAAKCGDVFAAGDIAVYKDAKGKVYVEDASGDAYNVNGKLVLLKEASEDTVTVAGLKTLTPVASTVYTVVHTYAQETKTAADGTATVTAVSCSACKANFSFVVGGVEDAVKKFGAGNYADTGLNAPNGMDIYVRTAATSVVTPSAGDKVNSAETFDAGIAMYVGMSVMAAAGSAVVLKKKD